MTLDFLWDDFSGFLQRVTQQSEQLPGDRRELLLQAAEGISRRAADMSPVNLLFVCTHNSRRSQFAQLWAAFAMQQLKADRLRSYSCGTEATACNPRTVAALRRAGVTVTTDKEEENATADNPHYRCSLTSENQKAVASSASGRDHVELFSKAFGHPSLPTENLVAMMCCDEADKNCPVVPGALLRVALHYRDPKIADGTPQEAAAYDERNLQIASEMLFLMRHIS